MSDWKSKSICDYDVMLYGILLHPCLFGENASHVMAHPSCVSHTLSYVGLGLTGNLLGSILGSALFPGSELGVSFCSSLGTSSLIGSYAGDVRMRLRKKYDIEGDRWDDFLVHAICSPCAICQEAQEIRLRLEHEPERDAQWTPVPQEMTGK